MSYRQAVGPEYFSLCMRTARAFLAASTVTLAAACTSPRPVSPSPAPTPSPAVPASPNPVPPPSSPHPALPPVPLAEGPLAIKLEFPSANQSLTVRDSNFIFGSVGNGHAELTINGFPVPVAPNGAFLSYLPVPPPTAPHYDLVAHTAMDSAKATVKVRVPPARPDLALTGRLVIDSASVAPRGGFLALRDDEPVRVAVRAPANADAWVVANGTTQTLARVGLTSFATDVPAVNLRNGGQLFVARDRDTVRMALTRIREPRAPQ